MAPIRAKVTSSNNSAADIQAKKRPTFHQSSPFLKYAMAEWAPPWPRFKNKCDMESGHW
jgi:hypothetical protein